MFGAAQRKEEDAKAAPVARTGGGGKSKRQQLREESEAMEARARKEIALLGELDPMRRAELKVEQELSELRSKGLSESAVAAVAQQREIELQAEWLRVAEQRADAMSEIATRAEEDRRRALVTAREGVDRVLSQNVGADTLESMRRAGEAAAAPWRDAGAAMAESLGVMAQFEPALGGLGQAVGQMSAIWADYAAGQTGVTAAILGSLKAMTPAVAGFIDGTKSKAGVMAAFEAAMATATFFTNPPEAAAHGIAAVAFGAIATGAVKTPGASGSKGSAAAEPSRRTPVDGGGRSDTRVVVNISGALGTPQDLARMVARAVHQARGTNMAVAL